MFKLKSSKLTEALGWYGMLALIVAYGLVSYGLITADGVYFQLLNLTGSAGLMIVAVTKKVIQSVILNIFWITIGLVALAKLFLQ